MRIIDYYNDISINSMFLGNFDKFLLKILNFSSSNSPLL